MKMLSIISILSTLSSAFIVSLSSCGQTGTSHRGGQSDDTGKNEQAPIAYDLGHPVVYNMPDDLREISGISFYQGDPSLLYAEQDEKGRLYWLIPGADKASHYDFGKDGDYEDLAFIGKQAVFLKSNGTLYSFDFIPDGSADGSPVTGKLQEWKDLLPKGEYEGLYADTGKKQLYVLCKECKNEDHKKTVTIFRLDTGTKGWTLSGSEQVDVTKISALSSALNDKGKHKEKKINFRPSAISFNTRTNEWYILSSINKMLVVTGADWQVKGVYSLHSKLYPQPEGMCFDKDNNLYISNEGPKGGKGTVLKFILKAG